jgi:hypothetical protein
MRATLFAVAYMASSDAAPLNTSGRCNGFSTFVQVLLPIELKGAEPLYRGRLWLDAETKQLWREERELTLRHPSTLRVDTIPFFNTNTNTCRSPTW